MIGNQVIVKGKDKLALSLAVSQCEQTPKNPVFFLGSKRIVEEACLNPQNCIVIATRWFWSTQNYI